MRVQYELTVEELKSILDLVFAGIRGKNKDLVELICMKLREKNRVKILK